MIVTGKQRQGLAKIIKNLKKSTDRLIIATANNIQIENVTKEFWIILIMHILK